MKRTFLLVLAAAMILTLTLTAGCGGSGGTTTTAAPDTTVFPDTTVTPPSGGTADGAALFATNCVVCHGAQGQGVVGPDIRPIGDEDKDRVVQQVTNGGDAMPPFGGQLSAAEIDAVAAYAISLQ